MEFRSVIGEDVDKIDIPGRFVSNADLIRKRMEERRIIIGRVDSENHGPLFDPKFLRKRST